MSKIIFKKVFGLSPHQMNHTHNTPSSSAHRRVVSSPEQHLHHSRDSEPFGKYEHRIAFILLGNSLNLFLSLSFSYRSDTKIIVWHLGKRWWSHTTRHATPAIQSKAIEATTSAATAAQPVHCSTNESIRRLIIQRKSIQHVIIDDCLISR